MSSFWQDRLTLPGRQGVYMSGQMRFEMAHGRGSQTSRITSPGSLESAPHAFEMFTLGETTYSDSVYCLHVDLVTSENF